VRANNLGRSTGVMGRSIRLRTSTCWAWSGSVHVLKAAHCTSNACILPHELSCGSLPPRLSRYIACVKSCECGFDRNYYFHAAVRPHAALTANTIQRISSRMCLHTFMMLDRKYSICIYIYIYICGVTACGLTAKNL
jgi:hypothetical protein